MNTISSLNSKLVVRLAMLVALVLTVGIVALRSQASTPLATVTITNNSSWEIRYLYLSAVDNDDWSDDQLGGTSIAPGATQTLNLSWNQSSVKLVAEDQDGCFMTTTADVSSAATWTITSSSTRNCGG